jgi:hypothetical protein
MVSARLLGLATACAAVLTLGLPAERASAQVEACQPEVISVTGRSKGGVKRWTQAQELEGKGAAMDDAVTAWEREVKGKFGEDWKLWTKAKDKSFNCAPAKGVLLMGVACTVRGRPCPAAAPDSGPVVAEKRTTPRKLASRADRWDDDERSGQGWGYRRAMQRQDQLAAARRRAEQYAWNRATARQSFLRAERRRAESRAMAREEARQRYLTARRDRIEGQGEYWHHWDWDDD